MNRGELAAVIMAALDSLWVSDGRVLGKLHARDEILAALPATDESDATYEMFPGTREALDALTIRPEGTRP